MSSAFAGLASPIAEKALPATIAAAARRRFIRELWREVDVARINTLSDLPTLPILCREDLDAYFTATAAEELPERIIHTTGTTGQVAIRGRSTAELQAYGEFIRALTSPFHPEDHDETQLPLTLTISAANHGDTKSSALPFQLVAVGYNTEVLRQCIQLLKRKYSFRGYSERIQMISCDLFMLKFLTVALLKQKIDPSALGVRFIVVTGDYVSARERELYGSDVWKANLVDRYSCAECVGGATHCWSCDCYNFDPMLVVEIVDPWTRAPRSDGAGLLTLTELYPFSIYQPMIRYQNGDLFEWVDSVCSCRQSNGVRFVGRLRQTPVHDRARCFVAYPVEIERALAGFPELVRISSPDMQLGPHSEDLGDLSGRIEVVPLDDGRVRMAVTCEPKFVPELFPDAARSLKRKIRKSLLAESRMLSRHVAADAVELTVELNAMTSRTALFGR